MQLAAVGLVALALPLVRHLLLAVVAVVAVALGLLLEPPLQLAAALLLALALLLVPHLLLAVVGAVVAALPAGDHLLPLLLLPNQQARLPPHRHALLAML